MLFTPKTVLPVPEVPVGKFFVMKLQNEPASMAFMAQQTASAPGHYSGPVVVHLSGSGGPPNPTRADRYLLGLAAVLPKLVPVVDLDSLEESSTEAFRLSTGRLLGSGEDFLLALGGGDLGTDNFVRLGTGEYVIGGKAGDWLSFSRWRLRLEDGSTVYAHDAAPTS